MLKKYIFLSLIFMLLVTGTAFAVPSQCGSTGLLAQPTASTLNSGNICVGFWGLNDELSNSLAPVAVTLGMGSLMEAYGSYPNLLFNDDENNSPLGYTTIGMKLRVWGWRSSPFKVSISSELRRWVNNDIDIDGLTDNASRLIVSYKPGPFGIHVNAGYSANEDSSTEGFADQTLYGAGIEYFLSTRFRLVAEFSHETPRDWLKMEAGEEGTSITTLGFQYYLSPHLTFNIGASSHQGDDAPEWSVLFGFSSCQGIGSYQHKIPSAVKSTLDEKTEKKVEKKIIKVRMLKPLRSKTLLPKMAKLSPVSKLEVPVSIGEEIVLAPSDKLSIPGAQSLKALSVAPVGAAPSGIIAPTVTPSVATTVTAAAAVIAANDALTVSGGMFGGRTYQLEEFVDIEGDIYIEAPEPANIVGKKISDELLYKTHFTSVKMESDSLVVTFYHNYIDALPVWVEGAVPYELSDSFVEPNTLVTLKVIKTGGQIGRFKLHVGAESEIFEFWTQPTAAIEPKAVPKPKPKPQMKVTPTVPVPTAPVVPETPRLKLSEPLDKPIAVKVYRKFRLPGFAFNFDQSTLTQASIDSLNLVGEQLRKDKQWFFIRVDGHTDSMGSNKYNQSLSLKRAISAATHLAVHDGVDVERVFIKGFGETKPIDDNSTDSGRANNRRIEILVLVPK